VEGALELLAIVGVVGSLAGYAYGYVTGRCSKDNPCPKCAFHVNEQRMAKLEAEHQRVEEAKRQMELRHDAAHKGFGWALGEPDKYNCGDEACARNVKGRKRVGDASLSD
jgi:hypothetical protein